MKKQSNNPLSYLRDVIKTHGTQKDAADHLGITPQYLHDILTGRREISANVAQRLGLVKLTIYEERK